MNELLLKLQEARNVGEWLEARLHLLFTQIADDMFGEGRLTRDERIALSSAIGGALDAFRATIEERAAGLYDRDPYRDPASTVAMSEAGALHLEEPVALLEAAAIRRDGTIPVKIIKPGWGTTGYYPAEVLERDGPLAYRKGAQMFWNHATPTEEAERPERDLDDLAAVLISDARWDANGKEGPGLYAEAKVFSDYADKINEKAAYTGLSIRGDGRGIAGRAEGRDGKIITAITSGDSVDFVTKAGAGGKVLLSESARHASSKETTRMDEKLLKEAQDQAAALAAQNARLQEALTLRDARDFVGAALAKSTLPAITQARLAESLSKAPPLDQAGALDKTAYTTQIAEAIRAETEYLQAVAGYGAGRVEGMGATSPAPAQSTAEADIKRMTESFRALGLTEAEAAIAANGRLQ